MARSPKTSKISVVWLGQWLSYLKVGQKIALGYGLALGVAVLGTTAGFTIADYYQKQALKLEEDAVEELNLLNRLYSNVLETQLHQQQLIALPKESPLWQKKYTQYLEYSAKAKQVWSEFKSVNGNIDDDDDPDEEREAVNRVLQTYDHFEVYLQQVKKLLQQVASRRSQVGEISTEQIQTQFLNLSTDSDFQLDAFSEDLNQLMKITFEEFEQAETIFRATIKLRSQIIFISLLLSIAIAALLASYTSRAIARPIQAVTNVAQQATQDSNFDLQAPVTTQDEVGVLAFSLNQLIQQVKQLLKEQIEANEQLEAKVEERTVQLQEKTSELEAILNAFPDLFFRIAIDTTVLDYKAGNQTSDLYVLPEEFLGKRLVDIFPPSIGEKLNRVIVQAQQTQSLVSIEYSLVMPNHKEHYEGRLIPFTTEQFIFIVRNVSDRKQAEKALRQSEARLRKQAQDLEQAFKQLQETQFQLVQSEKMSSLGQLVAGVAHEINNPVNFIHANLAYVFEYAQNLLRLLEAYQKYIPNPPLEIQAEIEATDFDFLSEDLPKVLNSMQVGLERIKEIVLSLRNFSRLDEAEFKLFYYQTCG
ncbi:HAMP domain-containing protein [Chlorogloeopsis fritschii PCC 9212]|uniref:sensor histidine kinase n=1 Tax=Chlorogloeopsis fritschii TaxID=1124 RepID=UPI00370DDF87